MPECSVEERAFLDAVADGESLVEARKGLFLSRIHGPLFDAAVSLREQRNKFAEASEVAFEACANAKCAKGGKYESVERSWLYDEIEAEIERRRAKAVQA